MKFLVKAKNSYCAFSCWFVDFLTFQLWISKTGQCHGIYLSIFFQDFKSSFLFFLIFICNPPVPGFWEVWLHDDRRIKIARPYVISYQTIMQCVLVPCNVFLFPANVILYPSICSYTLHCVLVSCNVFYYPEMCFCILQYLKEMFQSSPPVSIFPLGVLRPFRMRQ